MAKVIRRENESVDEMIKRFSRMCMEDGLLKELKSREYYKSKGQKRREKKQEQARNAWIRKMKSERYNKY